MVNYVTIQEAKAALKGSIIIRAVLVEAEQTGTKKTGGTFRKQEVHLRDRSSDMIITLWDDQIGTFKQDEYYMIENPFWKVYNNEPQLSLGKYFKIHPAKESDLLPFTGEPDLIHETPSTAQPSTPTEAAKPDITLDDYVKLAEKTLEKALPQLKQTIEETWALEQIIRKALLVRESKEPDKQRVGMYVKILSDSLDRKPST